MLNQQPILIASKNQGKIKEITKLLADVQIETRSLLDFQKLHPPEETGLTYYENAFQKALWAHSRTGLPGLADDSGIEVAALDNEPGVRSARFFGPGATDQQKNEYILQSLNDKLSSDRKARFVCVMILVLNPNIWFGTKGVVTGHIAETPHGENGFGYDPIFIPDGYTVTFAQMARDKKNTLSHRGKALQHMMTILERIRNVQG